MPLGIVLLTGASQGIGLATAEQLGKAGYKVYASCRDPENAEALQELSKKISNIKILALDVNSQESVDQAVTKIMKNDGTIDVLINNAGFGIYGPSEMHTIEEAQKIFNTNFFGVMRVNHTVVPIMRKALKGRIINLGSISGAIPSINMAIYGTSKAALESLSASDAYRYKKWNIKVILIQGGPIVTNFAPTIAFGTRFSKLEDNPYADVLHQDKAVWKGKMDKGIPASDVAKLIQKVIETPEPDFWYQTSQQVSQDIGRHFKDLTGNIRIPIPKPKL